MAKAEAGMVAEPVVVLSLSAEEARTVREAMSRVVSQTGRWHPRVEHARAVEHALARFGLNVWHITGMDRPLGLIKFR